MSIADSGTKAFLALASNRDLAEFLGVSLPHLTRLAYRLPPTARYREFSIPKRGGETRIIAAPKEPLKYIQRQLATALLDVYVERQRDNVHGFLRNRSVKTNARKHRGRRWVLNVDLKDFFPSIHFGRIRGMFLRPPYSLPPSVSTTLANLCCLNNVLPQGAPTSPIITNMLCAKLDRELIRLARRHGATVTRYADDITFSTNLEGFPDALARLADGGSTVVGSALESVVVTNGFQVNASKVRLQGRRRRQEVTGLTVNQIVNLRPAYFKQIRAMLHCWHAFGYAEAEQIHRTRWRIRGSTNTEISLRQVIAGKLAYLRMIRGVANPAYIRLKDRFDNLNGTSQDAAVWIVESGQAQGTGFFLHGVGFVTCYHVVAEGVPEIFKPNKQKSRFQLRRLRYDKDADLAICEPIETFKYHRLFIAQREPTLMQPVRLIGYPAWSEGATVSIQNGYISQLREHFRYPAALVTTQIITGTSGGPLLSAGGRVLGVAVKQSARSGADHQSLVVLAAALKALTMLAESPSPKPGF